MVRTDRHQRRALAGDSGPVEAVKVLARAHQTLVWERTRHVLRLRSALREFFPAALEAYPDLHAADTLALLAAAPDPAAAARLSLEQVAAALRAARRRGGPARAAALVAALRSPRPTRPSRRTAARAG